MNNNLTDLPDSEKDKAKLQPEEAILDLPDVKDIPGQEFVHVPELREMADTTIAGDDEEALQTVSELVSTAGFNPIMAGDLPVSRTLESMQLLLIRLNQKYKYNWLAGWRILHN